MRTQLEHRRGVHRAAAAQAWTGIIETVRGLGYRIGA
jgi:hypothetical protein